MVRARKSHESDEENTTKLKPALIHKAGGNRYVVYVSYPRGDDKLARVLVYMYNEIYAVNFMTRTLLGPTGTWVDRDPIGGRTAVESNVGIVISMYGDGTLHEALNYEPNAAELEFKDEFLYKAVMQLKYGSMKVDRGDETGDSPDRSDTRERETSGAGDNGTSGDGGDTGEAEEPRSPRGKRGARTVRGTGDRPVKPRGKGTDDGGSPARRDTTGYVTAGAIAEKLKTEARIVRGALRALGLEKPEGGWSWPEKEAKGIEGQIVAQLKKDKKL